MVEAVAATAAVFRNVYWNWIWTVRPETWFNYSHFFFQHYSFVDCLVRFIFDSQFYLRIFILIRFTSIVSSRIYRLVCKCFPTIILEYVTEDSGQKSKMLHCYVLFIILCASWSVCVDVCVGACFDRCSFCVLGLLIQFVFCFWLFGIRNAFFCFYCAHTGIQFSDEHSCAAVVASAPMNPKNVVLFLLTFANGTRKRWRPLKNNATRELIADTHY